MQQVLLKKPLDPMILKVGQTKLGHLKSWARMYLGMHYLNHNNWLRVTQNVLRVLKILKSNI